MTRRKGYVPVSGLKIASEEMMYDSLGPLQNTQGSMQKRCV